ncbi:glycosyltransferase family 4 protein [Patescibacteria group bacterium]|nr:glycosyltransferase family 4 protein [Patescibacteria group bacterium]MBU1663212.1 glycosyltransferase family 4 protein [Patescibacteria group bacterium]MBU1933770.1 glycosyltransferase family 4 protein [Patescibacteria group bacterium]MBU2007494.1 glycosyltransferase family 4 protein [Patescibacteria group bacterium]MBU2233759.1 glycosyltransferase family 4 protein [Patescibacteria group bacterium]
MIKISLISIGPKAGMAHYISGLANALSKHTKVTVVVADYLDKEYFNQDIKIIKIKTGKTRKQVLLNSFNIFNFYKIWRIFKKLDCDVAHFVSPHPWNFLVSFFIKQPIVYTVHDPAPHLGENSIVAFFYQLMVGRAKKIIVHSKIHKEYFLKKGFFEKRVFQIQHGDYSFLVKWQKPEIKEENNILFFGRIEKYKGIKYLLEAFYLVQKEIPRVKLVIAGQGDLSSYDLIKQSSNIEILNYFIPDSQIAELFQKAKLAVLPYIEATQSGVISIAYAFKKPVVATLVGGLPELVEDGKTGYLVKPFDSRALAQAIIKILEDDETRTTMGKNGFEKMKKELSWDKIASKTIEVYNNCLYKKA